MTVMLRTQRELAGAARFLTGLPQAHWCVKGTKFIVLYAYDAAGFSAQPGVRTAASIYLSRRTLCTRSCGHTADGRQSSPLT
jgi:hypothetical protein